MNFRSRLSSEQDAALKEIIRDLRTAYGKPRDATFSMLYDEGKTMIIANGGELDESDVYQTLYGQYFYTGPHTCLP